MFEGLRERTARNEQLFFLVVSFVLIAVIFINLSTLRSVFVGIFALGFYLFLNGKMLGRIFFNGENNLFSHAFGLFLLICLVALMGIFVHLVSESEFWYLLGMLLATIAILVSSRFLGVDGSVRASDEQKEPYFKRRYILLVYISYVVFFALSFFLLYNVRSGWIRGPIWAVIPPMFLQVYFIATVILGAIVLLPGKATLKLLCVVLHSIFSLSFVFIILYPGILYYDPWYTLARSQESTMLWYVRWIRQSFSVRTLNTFLKGRIVYSLVAFFAESLCIDRYWSNVLLVPVLWGVFAPLTLYRITKIIGGSKGTSILAAFLTIPNLYFLAWGKLTEAASLGIIFFLMFAYFLLRFLFSDKTLSVRWFFSSHGVKTFFPVLITFSSLAALHFLPMTLAISFGILAFALKNREAIQARFSSNLLLFTSLALSILLLPFAVIGRGILIPEIGTSAFSFEEVLDTSVWMLVFGVSEEFPVQDALLYYVFPLLGLIGFVYALRKKENFNKNLCFFLFLAFIVCLIDYRILEYAVVGEEIFGAGRIRVFRDIVALPFASIVIMQSARFLYDSAPRLRSRLRWKNILPGALLCISLSAWATSAVYETYEFYTKGLLPTYLEVEAVKYIDANTNGSYIVLAPHPTTVIGHGFMGYPNYEKMYHSFGKSGAPSEPSVEGMFELMAATEAEVGYFVVSFRGADTDELVAEASKVFGLFKVLNDENGEIYIFHYKIPPLPESADVIVFHWDAPSAYYVQNDLIRIVINPTTMTVDVVDFWGALYERIDLQKTLVDGNPVGNLTSVEFYDSPNEKWNDWDPEMEIPSARQFEFRLSFEEDHLVGSLESEKSSVDFAWESGREYTLALEIGDFTRLYMPGLISGEGSSDTNSREYGFLYTSIQGDNFTLQPAYETSVSGNSLTFNEIEKYCGFTLNNYMWYDLYVSNNVDAGHWAFIEVWLPDEVYYGTFPPLYYSVNGGETWIRPRYNVETESPEPIRTLGGVKVNWVVTTPRIPFGEPRARAPWWSYIKANGGQPELPENYTDSGGAQNRIIFGVYLPARDEALLRLGTAVYYVRPLKVSYLFEDSDNAYYGLHNMEENLMKFYNSGTSGFVGGFEVSETPKSLVVVENENAEIESILVTLPIDTSFSLTAQKEVDTTQDLDANGIPDLIE